MKYNATSELLNQSLEDRLCEIAADYYVLAKHKLQFSTRAAKLQTAYVSTMVVGTATALVLGLAVTPTPAAPVGIFLLITGSIATVFSGCSTAYITSTYQSMIDQRKTKKITKEILHNRSIDTRSLKKIDFSKMDTHVRYIQCVNYQFTSKTLPVNTEKTREQLHKVFDGHDDQLEKLNDLLNDRANYSYFPECNDTNDTEGGSLTYNGWRKIMGLYVRGRPGTAPVTIC